MDDLWGRPTIFGNSHFRLFDPLCPTAWNCGSSASYRWIVFPGQPNLEQMTLTFYFDDGGSIFFAKLGIWWSCGANAYGILQLNAAKSIGESLRWAFSPWPRKKRWTFIMKPKNPHQQPSTGNWELLQDNWIQQDIVVYLKFQGSRVSVVASGRKSLKVQPSTAFPLIATGFGGLSHRNIQVWA